MCTSAKAKEEWWVPESSPYAIASNHLTGHDDKHSVQTFGGHLVAESIVDPKIRAKILALPELLDAVAVILKPYDQDKNPEKNTPELQRLREVYNRATGS